ncbi:MAG: MBL fold metallo-hydrolase [Nitrospiraceae bacterium]|nr:MBL fold metallo-hydrolase [Nitrospiraceae bacterium]
MKITYWGARGSIPVSGAEYVKYGGDTTCIEVTSRDGDTIIVDAGTGLRKLGNKALASGRKHVSLLFTHAHWDHLMGFPFFKPIYMKGTKIDLYGCPYAQESVKAILSKTMMAPYFPVEFGMIQAEVTSRGVCDSAFAIGPVEITPIQLNHPNQGIGYRFMEDGKSFVFLTDNELTLRHNGGASYEEYVKFSEGADLLVHDAEYTKEQYQLTKGWGHSVYTDALRLALDARAKQFGLFHHNQERSDADLDKLVDDCNRIAAGEGAATRCFGVQAGTETEL